MTPISILNTLLIISAALSGMTSKAARARWQSHGISDYDIDVVVLCMPSYHLDLTLAVRDGRFDSIVEARQDWGIGWFTPEDYTISQSFDELESTLNHIDIRAEALHVKFDRRYGYINKYRYDYGYRLGVFTPGAGIADGRCQYTATNLQAITVPTSQLLPEP